MNPPSRYAGARRRHRGSDVPPGDTAEVATRPAANTSAGESSRSAFHVGAGILASRSAGMVREIVTAGFLGVGVASDAFKAALRIPNLLQNLLGEGVLSASFIPVYARLVDPDNDHFDEEEAGRTAGAVAGLLAAAVAVLVLVGMLAARPITIVLTPGFRSDPDKLALTVDLVRIMFPGVGVLVLSAWCLAILNSHRRFFLSYVAPVLWNVAQIVAIVAVAIGGSTQASLATGLAWGVVAGGTAQFVVQLPVVLRLVPQLRLSLDRKRPAVRDAIGRLGPVVFGRGVVQISGYLDMLLASLLATGAVTADNYAQFFYLLPVSLFGMAVAAAELPELSRLGVEHRGVLSARIDQGLQRVAFFVAPTAVLFITLGEPLIAALLQRGEFGPSDTRLIWLVLAAYSTGLLPTTASRLLQNSLYALDDPRSPARIALVRVAIGSSIALAIMFFFDDFVLVGTDVQHQTSTTASDLVHLGAVGIAVGSSIGAWIEFTLLRLALRWRVGSVSLGGGALAPVLTAALVSAAAGRLVVHVLPDLAPVLAAVPIFATAGAAYFAASFAFGVPVRSLLGLTGRR